MSKIQFEGYEEWRELLDGLWEIGVVSYRIGNAFVAKINNVDPGANIARARGATREEALNTAREKARGRLQLSQAMTESRQRIQAARAAVDKISQEMAKVPSTEDEG